MVCGSEDWSGERACGGDRDCCSLWDTSDDEWIIFVGVNRGSGDFLLLPALSIPGLGLMADGIAFPSEKPTPLPLPTGNGGRIGTLAGEPIRPPGRNLLSSGGLPLRIGEDSRLPFTDSSSSMLLARERGCLFLLIRTGFEI